MPQANTPSPSTLTLAVLERMSDQWETLPEITQGRFAKLVETYWNQLHRASFEQEWASAATEFQRGLRADPELAAVLHELLADASSIQTEMLPTQQEQAAILSALKAFPAPGASAEPLPEFDQPARALARVLELLRLDWNDLAPETHQQIAQLQKDLQARLERTRVTRSRTQAINDFLATLEALADVGPRIQSTLNTYRKPYPRAIDSFKRWDMGPFTAPSDDTATP